MKRWSALQAMGSAALTGALCAGNVVIASEVPQGIGASDWSSIRGAYDAARHAVITDGAGYRAWNNEQRWTARFDGRGIEVVPREGAWRWGLDLVAWGRERAERTVGCAASAEVDARRISYARDGTLVEWFVNDARGIEHGYTIGTRPDGEGPVVFTLSVRGELCAEPLDDWRGASFVDANGTTVLTYGGLATFDAERRSLPSWMDCAGDELRLFVDDRGATYPITVDPIAQQAYLKASNTEAHDWFGAAVAVDGDTVVVAAPLEDSAALGVNGNQGNGADQAGAAYVFVRSGNTWGQQAYLKASNTGANDWFGSSVAISGDTVVVGAFGEASAATGVNGDQANNAAQGAGAAYVFVRSSGAWTQQAYLKASNTGALDRFGASVGVAGNTVVVGAYWEDSAATGINGNQTSNTAMDSGAAYVFVRSGTVWTQQAYLKPSNTGIQDEFGRSIAVSGDTVVVGARYEDSAATGVDGNQLSNMAADSGAAYVFVRNGATWTQQAYLKAANTGGNDEFGYSVDVSGDTVVVGAPYEDSSSTGVNGNDASEGAANAGAAYVFLRNGAMWTQQAYLKASNTDANDHFAFSLGASGESVVVAAPAEGSDATGINGNQASGGAPQSGAAYLYTRNGTAWSQQAYLKASNTEPSDSFGESIAISGSTLVVGAVAEDSAAIGVNGDQSNNAAPDAGAAYVFSISTAVVGDVDGDGHVNASDLGLFLGTWGASGGPTDLDGDGTVGASDLGILLGAWTG